MGNVLKNPVKHVLLIQVANMVFFVMFLWNMLCGVWASQAGDPIIAQQQRQKMQVVIKMFFVMGVTWIAELISFFITWAIGDHKHYRELFFFQLINCLQVRLKKSIVPLSIKHT